MKIRKLFSSFTAIGIMGVSLSLSSCSLNSSLNNTNIAKVPLSTVFDTTLLKQEFEVKVIPQTVINFLKFTSEYDEIDEKEKNAYREEVWVDNISTSTARVYAKNNSAHFIAGSSINYTFATITEEGKQNINDLITSPLLAETLAFNFWSAGPENSNDYIRSVYANKYQLSPNQIKLENVDYTSNNAIKQKIAKLKISAVSDSNLYSGSKEVSFPFKPTLEAAVKNVTDIAITAALYGNVSSNELASSIFTQNSSTLGSAEDLIENTTLIYNDEQKTFTIINKEQSIFLDSPEDILGGTIFDDYRRVPWEKLRTSLVSGNNYKIDCTANDFGLKDLNGEDVAKYNTLDLENIPDASGKKITAICNYGLTAYGHNDSAPELELMKKFFGYASTWPSGTVVGCLKYLRLPTSLDTVGYLCFSHNYSFQELWLPDTWTVSQCDKIFCSNNLEPITSGMNYLVSMHLPKNLPTLLDKELGTGDSNTDPKKDLEMNRTDSFNLTYNCFRQNLKQITVHPDSKYKVLSTYNQFGELIGQVAVPKKGIWDMFCNNLKYSTVAQWGANHYTNEDFRYNPWPSQPSIYGIPKTAGLYFGKNVESELVDLPTNCTQMSDNAFGWGNTGIAISGFTVILNSATVVKITSGDNDRTLITDQSKFAGFTSTNFYVPKSSLSDYKNNWPLCAASIFSIDDLPPKYQGLTHNPPA